jgi:DNA-binding IclR family transcriptional regulator
MTIQSVERAISILNTIANERRPLGLPDLSQALGLPKTTIHTLVQTLKNKGFLQQDPSTRKYRLGFALFELGTIQMADLSILRTASPAIHRLASEVQKECRLGIWHNHSVIISFEAQPLGQMNPQIGPRIPAYCTALGKAILAFLPEQELTDYLENEALVGFTETTITDKEQLLEDLVAIRQHGVAISRGEFMPYRTALGAPIFGPAENLEGAVSMSVDRQQAEEKDIAQLSDRLRQTAYEISLNMGCQPRKAHLRSR